jgi:hypothetical protein
VAYPGDNLGDYLKTQMWIKNAGGSLQNAIGKEVANAAPSIIEGAKPAIERGAFFKGGALGALGTLVLASGAYAFAKKWAQHQQELADAQEISGEATSDESEVAKDTATQDMDQAEDFRDEDRSNTDEV